MADPIDVSKLEKQAASQGYIRRVLVGLDQFINVVAFGAPNDTISSRAWRWKTGDLPKPNKAKKLVGTALCWGLGKLQKDHDLKANVGDMTRAQLEKARTERTLKNSGIDLLK